MIRCIGRVCSAGCQVKAGAGSRTYSIQVMLARGNVVDISHKSIFLLETIR